MPGQGDLPLVGYVSALRQLGYDGPLSLEIFNDRFRAGSAADVALDGMRSLVYLMEQVDRRSESRTACKGIEFIEFCASEEEAGQLGQMLRMLGFTGDASPRSQEGVALAAGRHQPGRQLRAGWFCTHFDTVHGASVCAIGLRVADPDAALRRASELQAPSFSQPVGPGEYEIPALRGVGGSLRLLHEGIRDAVDLAHGVRSVACRRLHRCRSRAYRSFLTEHAVRGDALLAAVLRHFV